MPTYSSLDELDFVLADLPRVPRPQRVLMADPAEFDVTYAINSHMRDAAGRLQRVDRERARLQWHDLKTALEELGLAVDVVPPLDGHPDLVFCANQVLPLAGGEPRRGVPSTMATAERRGEVPWILRTLTSLGLEPVPLPRPVERLEGTGDGLFHPGRRLLWAGVGPRSCRAAWDDLAELEGLAVLLAPLHDPDYYHLDTALSLLDETSALWVPGALTRETRTLLEHLFERLIEADPGEARRLLACNAWCPDGRHVLIQSGAQVTAARLSEAGYTVLEVDTGEFLKAGGSVFCMKLAW